MGNPSGTQDEYDVLYGNSVCNNYRPVPSTTNELYLTVAPVESDLGAQNGITPSRWSAKIGVVTEIEATGTNLAGNAGNALTLHVGSDCVSTAEFNDYAVGAGAVAAEAAMTWTITLGNV